MSAAVATKPTALPRIDLSQLWLPYQMDWINDTSPIAICEKSRRVGMDYVEAFRAVFQRITGQRNDDLWYSSADEGAAIEWMEYVREFFGLFGAVFELVSDVQIIDKQDVRVMSVRLPEVRGRRPRINALSSAPRVFRGKGGSVTLSEFAFHDRQRDLWKAMRPVTTWGGEIRVLSTHNGEDSYLCEVLDQARRHAEPETYGRPRPTDVKASLHRTDILQAVAQGLAKRVAEKNGDPITETTDEDFIAGLRAGCGSEEVWGEEFLCIPSAASSRYFPAELLGQAIDRDAPAITDDIARFIHDVERTIEPAVSGGPLYVGVDVGRRKDHFSIGVIESALGAHRVRGLLGFTGQTFAQMEYALNCVMRGSSWSRRVRRACIDETGIGMQFAERSIDRYGKHRVEAVGFTSQVKVDLVTTGKRHLEDRTLLIPDDPELHGQFGSFKRTVTASGNVRFDADRSDSGHSDEAIALFLALHASDRKRATCRFLGTPKGVMGR